MHPAPSVILFTTFSGLGFGLLAWLGVAATPPTGWAAFGIFALAFGLSVGGLLASIFHLTHPARAWRAFSQWRSSWLSREGVSAVAALLVMGVYAAGLIFWGRHFALLGWFGAGLSVLTVFTTAMIYAQLRAVPRWNTPLTPLLFLTLAVTGGALVAGPVVAAMVLLGLCAIVQILWWWRGDGAFDARQTTIGTATGLGDRGAVRAVMQPHSAPNYLMREFVYVIGRKHAAKLRLIALLLMAVLPMLLLALPAQGIALPLAILCHALGVATARWLFFAQAEHVVGLYYGLR